VSFRRCESLADLSRHGFCLRILCPRCGHERFANPGALMLEVGRRGGSIGIASLGKRLRCTRCGTRGAQCRPWHWQR
jgi:DNA-directed RNA polymerase subunit RPC12/RpoP